MLRLASMCLWLFNFGIFCACPNFLNSRFDNSGNNSRPDTSGNLANVTWGPAASGRRGSFRLAKQTIPEGGDGLADVLTDAVKRGHHEQGDERGK